MGSEETEPRGGVFARKGRAVGGHVVSVVGASDSGGRSCLKLGVSLGWDVGVMVARAVLKCGKGGRGCSIGDLSRKEGRIGNVEVCNGWGGLFSYFA